ncbi:hypothetical protein [Dyadobacter sp. CY312]|uniref:hypothetical protein n=1 Tax=Dyadobacter sp. CY312 TaxID=2907303 RepID=UPI001F295121|nr:hypothetical protein [Dyadobacter sp. CY312]MCE7044372.1 hypothetical protein [Dyadobacter sp. CY312]
MDNVLLYNPYLFEYLGLLICLLLLFGATFFNDKLLAIKPFIGIGLIITPIVYFFLILNANLLNIPFTDDYNLLETIHNFRKETDFVKSMEILFEQVNQHRFPFERSIMLIMVFFTGTVNIKLQILLGNLFMLGTLYLFFLSLKKESISWYYFIPVPYILFNLVYFENAFWGIAAIQNTPLIFFALLSAYGLGRNDSKGWIIGLLAAIFVTFVSGNGMLAWIIGGVILTLQTRYKLLIQWVIIATAILLFYFLFDYQFITSEAEKPWRHPIFNMTFLLGFWGNALYLDIPHPSISGFYTDMILCVLAGIVIALAFLAWFARTFSNTRLQWNHWLIMGAFMFIMGTGCMFVISRPMNTWLMHGGNIFSRRYMIFGVVALATAYMAIIMLLKRYERIQLVSAVLGMATFLSLHVTSYYMSLPQMRRQYEELALDGYFFKNFSTFLTTGIKFGDIPFWNHPTRMKELVHTVEDSGLSRLLASDSFPEHKKVIEQTGNQSEVYKGGADIKVEIRRNEQGNPPKSIRFTAGEENGIKPSYFVLVSENHTILLPALPVPNNVEDFIKKRTYYSKTYQYTAFRTKLPAGSYALWVMSKKDPFQGKWESKLTGKRMLLY